MLSLLGRVLVQKVEIECRRSLWQSPSSRVTKVALRTVSRTAVFDLDMPQRKILLLVLNKYGETSNVSCHDITMLNVEQATVSFMLSRERQA